MHKTYIIAEAGVNHNGSLELAKNLVDVAVEAGADAVKFQTFHAEDLVCRNAPKAKYQIKTTEQDESQYSMLKALELSGQEQVELQQYCLQKKIEFLSSPFDLKSADFLMRSLNLSTLKIASGEITNFPLLLKIAQAQRSIILSTGMSTLGEIESALALLAWGYLFSTEDPKPSMNCFEKAYFSNEGQSILQEKISLLHCTSEYPAPFEEVNLRAMQTMRDAFNLPVGYSDHTLGTAVSIAAVAQGAQIIEKHFTLDKKMQGPDHQASLEPHELAALISGIRQVELAIGGRQKLPRQSELKNRSIARKSLVALKDVQQGDVFNEHNLGCKRPANGVAPSYYYNVYNKLAGRDYVEDELIEL